MKRPGLYLEALQALVRERAGIGREPFAELATLELRPPQSPSGYERFLIDWLAEVGRPKL